MLWKWYKFRRSATRSVKTIDMKNGAGLPLMPRNGAEHFTYHAFKRRRKYSLGCSRVAPAIIRENRSRPFRPVAPTPIRDRANMSRFTAHQEYAFCDKKLAYASIREAEEELRYRWVGSSQLKNCVTEHEAARRRR